MDTQAARTFQLTFVETVLGPNDFYALQHVYAV